MQPVISRSQAGATPLMVVTEESLADVAQRLGAAGWVAAHGYRGRAGEALVVPGEGNAPMAVLVGVDEKRPHLSLAQASSSLPEGVYVLPEGFAEPEKAALFWALNAYSFNRYNRKPQRKLQLVVPQAIDLDRINAVANAVTRGRDLINTPANDLGTQELADAVKAVGEAHGALVSVIVGDDLITRNFPLIHAVGRASPRAPRLIDLRWGNEAHPKVTLVGKGIVFDTGGLDIKPSPAMLLMKKDMGGAAATMALAEMIMAARLPVRLRLLVPAAENAISGNAFRPGDILPSRKGLSVEIGNTDAEGRLVLADALALGDEESPDLMISMATLTGAARVALGPDLPPLYCNDEAVREALYKAGEAVHDPMWPMPLHAPYMDMLNSRIADINHVSDGPFAGSITAALFLTRFVEKAKSYVHFDIYGWSPKNRPGVPMGGEVQCARAIFHYLEERFGK